MKENKKPREIVKKKGKLKKEKKNPLRKYQLKIRGGGGGFNSQEGGKKGSS